MYVETHCINCGCLIPEGDVLCLHCSEYDDMQTFKYLQPERKKGNWVEKPMVHGAVYCSVCGYELIMNSTKFCPECGADMRIEGEQP